MLEKIVVDYLRQHKRLVVPQLGAFIVKEPGGRVLFSELLRRDDGVLRGLLQNAGMNELEAAGAVDRFVFEIRHAVRNGAGFAMEGLGRFRRGPNDTTLFEYDPAACPAHETGGQPHKRSSVDPAPETTPVAGEDPATVPPAPASFQSPLEPDPTLKGLRYGKPRKTAGSYTYAERGRRRKADRFLLMAILAAVIAVAAIAFGYYVSGYDDGPSVPESFEPAAAVRSAGNPAAENPSLIPQE